MPLPKANWKGRGLFVGTGLGLSIVKHSAKLHHAEIRLQSTLGKGTKITISFPKRHIVQLLADK